MPGKRISELTALSGAASANNDDLLIFDSGAGETKRISRSQLAEGMIDDLPFLYFHGVLTSDPTQRLNGDSLEIGDGYLRSSDMIFRYYTASGWQNYEQIAIAAAQAWAEGTEPGGAGTYSSKEWSETSQDWAEGTEPGGAGTKSAKEWSDQALANTVGAQAAQTAAEAARDTAVGAKDLAIAAADASGDINFYDTKAAADAALGGLTEGQIVEVMEDESRGDLVSRYRVESAAYVFKYHPRGKLTYIDAREYGVLGDSSNVTTQFTNAVSAALSLNLPIKFPQGQIRLTSNVFITIPANQTLRFFSDGGTELFMDSTANGVFIDATSIGTYMLAADADIGDAFIEVSDVTGLAVGDTMRIKTNTAVETGWNYRKTCIRRISEIVGTTLYLDQALDFFFTAAEVTGIDFYKPARFESDHIDYRFTATTSFGSKFVLRNHISGLITNGKAESPNPGWSTAFSDGIQVPYCDGVIFDNFDFIRLRYSPQIIGARNIQVKNCKAIQVRHLDANSWAQDILYENIVGIDTDGIIQTHPCIRPVFRNVSDFNSTYGSIDLRGVGEVVEDCQFYCKNPGGMTNSALITDAYENWAKGYKRKITRLKAKGCLISGGRQGGFTVQSCEVGQVGRSSYYYSDAETFVSSDTVLDRMELDLNRTNPPMPNSDMRRKNGEGKLHHVDPIYEYRTRWRSSLITGASQANPCVITSARHGYVTGDQVTISGVVGMTQLNGNTYTITVVNADSYSLDSTDSTGFTTYTSGGLSRLVTPIKDITGITQASPAVVTVVGHGYSAGDVLWLNGVSGMTQINRVYAKVANPTTDTFEITYLNDTPIDATGFTAYSSGGKVCLQELVITIDAQQAPGAGFLNGPLKITTTLARGLPIDQRFYRFDLKMRTYPGDGGSIDQSVHAGKMRVLAYARNGHDLKEYGYRWYTNSGGYLGTTTPIAEDQNPARLASNSCNSTFIDRLVHGYGAVRAEGELDFPGANWSIIAGARHYECFAFEVDTIFTFNFFAGFVIEMEVYRQNT
jgi:hypothetical protein